MNQPWLTMIDCPVSAFDSKAAKNNAVSATSATLDLFFAGYIHCYADSSLAFRVDFFCDCVGSSLIQVGDCNFRPFARKKDSYLLTNPARGTSDDSNFVF